MILKKLREQRGWSQEHLARCSGLSARTIQRIESGHKASLESFMSLASALEVDLKTLQQEMIMIDKQSKEWRAMPLLAKLALVDTYWPLIGFKNRKQYQRMEIFFICISVVSVGLSLVLQNHKFTDFGLICVMSAYIFSLSIRVGDHYKIW